MYGIGGALTAGISRSCHLGVPPHRSTAAQLSTTAPIIAVNPSEGASTAATSPANPPAKSAEVPASPAPLDPSALHHTSSASTVTAVGVTNGQSAHDTSNETLAASPSWQGAVRLQPRSRPRRVRTQPPHPTQLAKFLGRPQASRTTRLVRFLPGGTEANSVPRLLPRRLRFTPAPPSSVLQQAHLLKSAPPLYPQIAAERGDRGRGED